MAYEVSLTPEAIRTLGKIPPKVAPALIETMRGPLADEPRRVGKPLAMELEGLWAARRGEYRIVYAIDEEAKIVTVHRIAHRRDVYRRR